MDRNIAVIGCGHWGKNLVRNFAELGALDTICDGSLEVLNRFETLYPDVNRETNFAQVLAREKIRGVVISTPTALHYSMTKQALLANKDVFVEKPLSLRVEEGVRMVQSIEEVPPVNAIILRVAHEAFRQISLSQLSMLTIDAPILIDVPGLYTRTEAKQAGFHCEAL